MSRSPRCRCRTGTWNRSDERCQHRRRSVVATEILRHALTHATRRAVGKGETQHVGISHTSSMGVTYALGQYLGFATARRGEHQMASATRLYHFLLTGIVHRCFCVFRLSEKWAKRQKTMGRLRPHYVFGNLPLTSQTPVRRRILDNGSWDAAVLWGSRRDNAACAACHRTCRSWRVWCVRQSP